MLFAVGLRLPGQLLLELERVSAWPGGGHSDPTPNRQRVQVLVPDAEFLALCLAVDRDGEVEALVPLWWDAEVPLAFLVGQGDALFEVKVPVGPRLFRWGAPLLVRLLLRLSVSLVCPDATAGRAALYLMSPNSRYPGTRSPLDRDQDPARITTIFRPG